MDEADLKRRVKGLEAMLARDFGIHSRAELLEAMKHMQLLLRSRAGTRGFFMPECYGIAI